MKICRYCNQTKLEKDFYIALTTPAGKVYGRHKCKTCYQETKRQLQKGKRAAFQEFKKTLKCEECGNGDHRVLQFHHKDGNKEANIADICYIWSQKRLEKELEKCCVLCANCHTIHHYEEKMGLTQNTN